MSFVTSVLIISSNSWFNSLSKVDHINVWLKERGVADTGLKPLDSAQAGGTRLMPASVFAAGLELRLESELISFFQSLDWPGTLLVLSSDHKEIGYKIVANGR